MHIIIAWCNLFVHKLHYFES